MALMSLAKFQMVFNIEKAIMKLIVPRRSIGSELPYPSVSKPSLNGSVSLISYSSSKP